LERVLSSPLSARSIFNDSRFKRSFIIRIHIANLSIEVTEDDLRAAFAAFGRVTFVNIVREHAEYFGMVGMPAKPEARKAVANMNGKNLKGKTIAVTEAGVQALVNPVSTAPR
jgi:RNA recognition motif-containing protein